MVSRRGHEMWFVGPRLRYHKCAWFVPCLCHNKCAWFVGRLCQPNVCLKIMRSTKQVTRDIIQSERDVIRVTPEKIMMICVIFVLHYILLVWKAGYVNHVGEMRNVVKVLVTGIAWVVYRLATDRAVRCSNHGGGDVSRARSRRPPRPTQRPAQ